MGRDKEPARVLVERSGVDWQEFLEMARLPEKKRPSFRSAAIFWGVKDQRKVSKWFKRFDEERKK